MDRTRIRILGGVAAKRGENPLRRRGKGSSTMSVSRGLVGPKDALNRSVRKGSRLIFLHRSVKALHLTHRGSPSILACMSKRIKGGECRNGENHPKA
jgi:hypothetical protein